MLIVSAHFSQPIVDFIDERCAPPEAIPMLLSIPNVSDFLGGNALLGLGDIVIPALLLSYVLRWELPRYRSSIVPSIPKLLFGGGYYSIAIIGYAVGLLLANLAVQVFHMGQPALLYLVPCTLGPVILRAKRFKEFDAMWTGILGVGPMQLDSPSESDTATLLQGENE